MKYNCDFSGLEIFWDIYTILKNDSEPSPQKWDSLFSTPGYRALIESEFTKEFFIKRFRLAYKPSLMGELKEALVQDKYGFLKHYLEVGKNKAQLTRFEKELTNKGLQEPLKICLKWLPFDKVDEYPPISYVVFANDGRGYIPIIVDILACLNLYDFMQLFLAHEMHHYYRRQHLTPITKKLLKSNNKFLRVLDQIQCEGIADCIDKSKLIEQNHPFIAKFNEKVANAPEFLALFDKTLTNIKHNKLNLEEAGELLNDTLPQSGHPIGFYMAQTIIASGLKDELIRSFNDSFEFFILYSQAVKANKSDRYNFSNECIETLNDLKNHYNKFHD